MDGLANVV